MTNGNWRTRIELNPDILVGKPIIKGTRLSVDFVLDLLAHDWSVEKIIKNYPQLQKTDVTAVLEYSSQIIKLETLHPLE